jgi:hypothetical protein
MQRCPKCNRSYPDDAQKFCTFDGGRLMIDTEAPTTFDLGPAPQTDPLGATVMGPAPDLNRTVTGGPLTSEIPPSAPTGPTHASAPTWSDAPAGSSAAPQPPATSYPPPPSPPVTAPTGPTTTSPLSPPAGAGPSASAAHSGTSSASLPPPSAGAAQYPQTGPVAAQSGALGSTTAAPPGKSNRMLLLGGGLLILLLLLLGGGIGLYFFALRPQAPTTSNSSSPSLEREPRAATNTNANTSNTSAAEATSQPPVQAPPNSTRFVNSRDKVTGSLAEHFVDFSLYYPNNWIVDTKAGTSGSSNFFRATRHFQDKPDGYVLEIMSVGWYQSNGTMQLDRPIFPNRVEYFNTSLAKDFPEYQKVSEGETSVGGLDAYQFTFKSTLKDTDKGDVNLWGRVVFLPVGSETAKNGVVLIMVASSELPEIKGVADVGEKGELPVILKTFRFGSSS